MPTPDDTPTTTHVAAPADRDELCVLFDVTVDVAPPLTHHPHAPPRVRTRARPEPPPPVAAPLPSNESATGLLSLGRDELSVLLEHVGTPFMLEHVGTPFMLKLACTATRDAAPTATETPRSAVVARVPLLQKS